MKIILAFVAACALVSTVRSAPFESVVKSQDDEAKEQHSFHFYDKAAKQDDQFVRDLIGRALQSQDDLSSVEIQGWFDTVTDWVKTNGPKICRTLYPSIVQNKDKTAEEQHSFHFYEKAAKQDDKLIRDLIGRTMQSQDDPNVVEMQGLSNFLKKNVPLALKYACSKLTQPKVQKEDKNAEEQHSFHFYQKAAKQDDQLVRDLIARAMQSQDDPNSVELQGWFTDALKKYGPGALRLANSLVNGGSKIQEEDKNAEEEKAAMQDDKLVRDLIARAMQSQDDPNSVELQGWFTDALKKYGPGALRLANSLVNGGSKIQEEDKNAEEEKAAMQDDKLVRDLIARAMQSQDDPNSVELQGWFTDALKKYGPGALQLANSLVNGGSKVQEEDKNAEDQHSFHFYQKAAKQDDQLVRDLIARAMQSQDDPNSVELQGWFTDALKKYGPGALQLANSLVNGGSKVQEEDKNAEEQHDFHFYQKAVKQDDQLVRDLIARAMQSQDDPNSVELQGWFTDALKKYGPGALQLANSLVNGGSKVQEEDKNAEEQHDFHFYEKAAKQDDNEVPGSRF